METIYEVFKKEICNICKNKDCNEELRTKIDGSLKCESFERCMKTQCNRCKNEKECFSDEI